MSRDDVHLLKIRMESGAARRSLLRALNSYDGPYRTLYDPAVSNQTAGKENSSSQWITFGSPSAYSSPRVREWVVNKNMDDFLEKSAEKIQTRLRVSGLASALIEDKSRRGTYLRRYTVQVFHLQVLQILPFGKSDIFSPLSRAQQPDPESKLWKRLSAIAIRALYSFGLEMGEVIICAAEEGKFTIEGITATPDMGKAGTAELFARAIIETQTKLSDRSTEDNLLMGMDPEFLLYDKSTSRVVPASRYLDRQGEAGCDSLRFQGRVLFPLVELRPRPGREPREVMVHLLRAFRTAQASIANEGLLWQAGGMPQHGFPLGGHLHFSGIPLNVELLRTLDNYLALPLAVLEENRTFRRRPRYGFLGDYRLQGYGGFEYRTLPSFLISPLVTKGVVALARLIVEDEETLTARPLQDDRIYYAFYEGRQEIIRDILPPLISDITSAKSYSRYESYIAPFLAAVMSGRTWDESTDIRKQWKIQNHS